MRTLLLIPVFVLAGCGDSSPPASVEARAVNPKEASPPEASSFVELSPAAQKEAGIVVQPLQPKVIPETLRVNGRIVADDNRSFHVGAITEGRVVKVLANAGDRVDKGQVLARMHSHDIHESLAEYQRAVAEQARAKAAEDYARRARDRARRLYDLKAGSLAQVDESEANLRNAATVYANAGVDVERARRHIEEFLGIPIESAGHDHGPTEDEADLIPVRAPSAGTVLTRGVSAGSVVTAGAEMFEISDLSRLWVMAEVNEESLASVKTGMPAKVYVQAYGDQAFPGRVGRIGDKLDPATRTVPVRVDVGNPAGRLKPEMYATIELETGRSAPSLFVPNEAFQELRGRQVVFVRTNDGRFEARPVQTGAAALDGHLITGGLKAGEQVVTRGSFILKSEFLKASMAEE